MKKPTLKALTELGADQRAEAMVELARTNEDIARYIARVTSDATTNVKRIKAEISKIRRRRRFIPYAESSRTLIGSPRCSTISRQHHRSRHRPASALEIASFGSLIPSPAN